MKNTRFSEGKAEM